LGWQRPAIEFLELHVGMLHIFLTLIYTVSYRYCLYAFSCRKRSIVDMNYRGSEQTTHPPPPQFTGPTWVGWGLHDKGGIKGR